MIRAIGIIVFVLVGQSAPSNSFAAPAPPAGRVEPYDPSGRFPISAEQIDRSSWPVWRRNVRPLQWIKIEGSDLSTVSPKESVPGRLSSRINAWNGMAADRRGSRLFIAGNGGHADYSGNEAYEIDLSKDEPVWRLLREPTPREYIVASNASKGIFNDYYLDGRPSSTHTYYALSFLATRNAIFKFGAGSIWGTGNEKNWHTDAFSLAALDWMPAGSWPDVVPGSRKGALAASICLNPDTEEVYIAAPRLRRFDPRSGGFETLARWPMNATSVYARACAVDPTRNRVVFFGDAYRSPSGGLVFDIVSGKIMPIEFSGEDVKLVTRKDYNFAWYEPRLDRFLLKTRQSGVVHAIHPETFAIERVPVTGGENVPDAYAGVHTRWQRLPMLGGYAYYPRHGSGIWFLAIE